MPYFLVLRLAEGYKWRVANGYARVPGLVTRRGNLRSDWTVQWSGMLIKRPSHRGRSGHRERMPVRITFCDDRFDPETQN